VLGLIELGVNPWLAALIVAVVGIGVGAILASSGVKQLQRTDITPTQTAATVRENVEFVKEQMK
jgi:uncharacterized membrane-anchored protein YhcB (DUF1043 family)